MANASSLDEAAARKLAEAIGAFVSPRRQPVPVGFARALSLNLPFGTQTLHMMMEEATKERYADRPHMASWCTGCGTVRTPSLLGGPRPYVLAPHARCRHGVGGLRAAPPPTSLSSTSSTASWEPASWVSPMAASAHQPLHKRRSPRAFRPLHRPVPLALQASTQRTTPVGCSGGHSKWVNPFSWALNRLGHVR